MKFRSCFSKKKGALTALAFLLTLSTATIYAAITATVAGPFWSGGNYTFTVDVTAISNPDHEVCIEYDIGQTGTFTKVPCTCSGGACPTGEWTCAIPGPQPNTSIDYDISGWSAGANGGSCGSEKTDIPGGEGTVGPTGPTAIAMQNFEARSQIQLGWTALLGVLMLGGVTGFALRKNKTNQIAS